MRRADTGEEATLKAESGDLLLVYFGYTSCPDICPTTLSDIQVAMGDLSDDERERVTVAMATVDPDRDTDEVVTNYLAHFTEHGMPLRATDADELANAAKAFGVQYEVAEHEPGDTNYEVGHTAVTYVVDADGEVVVEWPFGLESESMTSDLEQLLKEA